jgi:hypothetical protein
MARTKALPARELEAVHEAFPAYRQSLLGVADNCLLSARFELEGLGYTNAAQARGIVFHRYAAEVLRTLRRTGEVSIPVAEALEILYEVSRQTNVPDEDVVIVPARERRLLRIAAIALVGNAFNMTRLIDVERRLYATVDVDGVERRITGQPDALLADPPDGAIVLDWKTTPSAPPARTTEPSHREQGDHAHVSYEGYWQQRFYALLVMRNYPSVKRVTLREFYVLEQPGNRVREATVTRDALEHVEREIADVVALLDRALVGGSESEVWQPSPGKHCAYCRRPTSCPIERQARVAKHGITSAPEAARFAAEYVLADTVRQETREALKAYHDLTGHPIPVKAAKGRYELRWGRDSAGGRRFDVHVPAASDRGAHDLNLEAAFMEAAQRKAAA